MTEPIISVSGLRGVIGESLSPQSAIRYACSFAAHLDKGPVVITRDGRATGRMLADAVRSGLQAVGRDVIDADVAATPTTGVLVREHRAAGGIQISASHNPPEYNGLKLIGSSGHVISAAAGENVRRQYDAGRIDWVSHAAIGRLIDCPDSTAEHEKLVLATVDVDRIRAATFKVALDSNRGSGSVLGRQLLIDLGCELEVLGGQPDGKFEHPAEPTEENLASVLPHVARLGVDVTFCQDPDADRLAVIDQSGRYLGEEYTLAMCVDHVLRQKKGPIVTNCSTSRMSEDLAKKYNVPFFRSAVGEANVVDVMRQHDAILGGEGNGGVIDPRVGFIRDSFVGMALLLDAMAQRGAKISQLADELPRYAIVKTKINLPPEKVAAGLDALAKKLSDARADRLDGLRLDWPDAWLLVRPSNTEPIVRAIAEASTKAAAEKLCRTAAELLASV